jgi:hypothetical protein
MNNLVIVALPREDDYVNKISSEKVPHMTLLFLGEDVTKVQNLASIIDFVKHAADQSLIRFGMEVDRRGELGPDNADVVFFSKTKWSGFPTVNEYRSYLLKDNNIHTAYDSAIQFPEWIPHLTLGTPDAPAKPDERDYPGINYVEFDRIAVWFRDSEGIEFPLKAYEWNMDMAMSTVNDILSHYGVLGMKWGRRGGTSGREAVTVTEKGKRLKTSGGRGHPTHSEAIAKAKVGQILKKSGTKSLSNSQLKAYNERMNLEANAKRLSVNDMSAGKRFIAVHVKKVGSQQVSEVSSQVASQQVKKHLTSRLIKTAAVAAA